MDFCTYFDSYYMIKGLALYRSLERVTDDFHLYVMALDKECYDKLLAFRLEHMTVEYFGNIETPELLAVKPTRSKAEYCWTCGPTIIEYFLHHYGLKSITYLDSDLMFMSNPQIITDESKDASVVLTEQGLGEKEAKLYGKYCVQYLTFRNDENGRGALKWWKVACIDWCFQRFEDNKYGDQKYLDEFPKRWENVYVIKNLGVGIAPWNMHRYKYLDDSLIYKNIKYPYVFFHMHGIKIEYKNNDIHLSISDQSLSKETVEKFFYPYTDIIKDVLTRYYGYPVNNTYVHDLPIGKKIEYKIRGTVRNNKFIRWVWFSLLKRTYQGHGTKI